MTNPLLELQQYGQSAWLDYIHRKDIKNGALQTGRRDVQRHVRKLGDRV